LHDRLALRDLPSRPPRSGFSRVLRATSRLGGTRIAISIASSSPKIIESNKETGMTPKLLSCSLILVTVLCAGAARARTINFSGLTWNVKSSGGDVVGPGPNYFSDDTNTVWVDKGGRLHLKINKTGDQWRSAEVISTASFGYGTYRFYLETPVDDIDPRAVLGLFTWSTDPAYWNREIDIEFTRWSNPTGSNGHYVVPLYSEPGHTHDFTLPGGYTQTTHAFTWRSDAISFWSLIGACSSPADPSQVFHHWRFDDASSIPVPGGENVRMNLWLHQGKPPMRNAPIEVVISRFEFQS